MRNIFKTFIVLTVFTLQLLPQSIVTYQNTDEIFFNPERGFTAYRSNPITISFINSLKAINVSVIQRIYTIPQYNDCLLYTSDAADERSSVDLGGRRIINKKNKKIK